MNDVSSTDPMVRLAELMLNADEARAKSDEDALRAARQAQQQALREELDALHEAADDVRVGAWVEGAATVAGGTMAATAYAETPVADLEPTHALAALRKSGEALEKMAAPLGRELGEAPSMDARADAKQAEQEGADAATRAELANRHHERVLGDQERTLATLQSVLESESEGNLALIANV
jgi:hypothetical protein